MGNVIIDTDNGFHLEFGKGNFDDYCVYVSRNNVNFHWLKDEEYFRWLKGLSKRYNVELVYNDFKYVYDNVYVGVTSEIANKVIREVDRHYREHTQQWWSIYFMTMLAEELKENSILGKRIKHLGVYNFLFDKYPISYIVRYMRGMYWEDLDELMNERGI